MRLEFKGQASCRGHPHMDDLASSAAEGFEDLAQLLSGVEASCAAAEASTSADDLAPAASTSDSAGSPSDPAVNDEALWYRDQAGDCLDEEWEYQICSGDMDDEVFPEVRSPTLSPGGSPAPPAEDVVEEASASSRFAAAPWRTSPSITVPEPASTSSAAPTVTGDPRESQWYDDRAGEGRKAEAWRPREGHVDGGRHGNRGGQTAWWWTARHRAARQGPHVLQLFLKNNPKPKSKAKAKGEA